MTTFKVIKPGPFTTVQDGGRTGYSHIGLTEGGAMDFRSFALANRLVGNPIGSAALEITFGGLTLQCLAKTTIALTGAYCPLVVNGKTLALWQSHQLNPGDLLEVGFAALGVRSYLAITGGFDTPCWFHSRATVVREGLGESLQQDQSLNSFSASHQPILKLNFQDQPSLRNKVVLEFVPGYQWERLTEAAQQTFLNSSFQVSARSDRMGCQLDGPDIKTDIDYIYSEGIATGSIQITGEGKPIILMRDHQTIGGYPKLGAITTESQSVLAQLPAGSEIRFRIISSTASIKKLREFYDRLETIPLLSS